MSCAEDSTKRMTFCLCKDSTVLSSHQHHYTPSQLPSVSMSSSAELSSLMLCYELISKGYCEEKSEVRATLKGRKTRREIDERLETLVAMLIEPYQLVAAFLYMSNTSPTNVCFAVLHSSLGPLASYQQCQH